MTQPTPTLASPNPAQQLLLWVERHRWLIVAGVILVYLAGFNGRFRIEPDSALYLSLGRNLAEGKGYTYHGQAHHLAYPGLPWLHAGLFKLFGAESLLPHHVLMLLMALVTLALVYRLFLLHENRATALVMLVGMAGVKTFYRFGFELRNDMPFTLGAMAFLCGWEALALRQRRPVRPLDWFLLIGGLMWAMVMRPTSWALLLAVGITGLISVIRRPRFSWRVPINAGCVIGLILLFRLIDPRHSIAEESSGEYEGFVVSSFTTHLRQTLHTIAFERVPALLLQALSDAMFQVRLSVVNAVLSLLVIVQGLMLARRRMLWGVWVAVTLLMMAAILPLDRIALPILPLLVYGWWRFIVWVCQIIPGTKLKWLALLGLLAFGIGNNGSKIGGYIMVQHAHDFYHVYDRGEHAPMIEMAGIIQRRVEPAALVLIKHNYARAVTFLSHRDVYDRRDLPLPDPGKRPVYLVEPGDETIDQLLADRHWMPGEILDEFKSSLSPIAWRLRRVQPAPATPR